MITTTFDGSGNQTGTTNTSASGGSSITKVPIKMGNFWSNGTMPSSGSSQYGPFIEVLQKWNNSPVAAIDSSWTATANGYVNLLTLYSNGSTAGSDCNAYLVKNGTVTTLKATANVANGGSSASFYGNGGSSFPFVKGDLLKVFINSPNSSVDQSFSAGLEVVYT